MATRRRRLRDAPLHRRVAVVSLLGAMGLVRLTPLVGRRIGAGELYPVATVACFVLVMALVVRAVRNRHPFPRFGPANGITTLRAVIASLVAGLTIEPPSVEAAWFVVGAAAAFAALDGVDGWLARRTRLASPFGARFDMEIDALLILLLSILVWRFDKAGVWVLGCGLMRYAFVGARWVWPWLAGPLTPTFRGKAVAALQVAGLALALAPAVPWPASHVVAALTLGALTWSFAIDVQRLRTDHVAP